MITVAEFEDTIIVPAGMKVKQKRDTSGRFISGFDIIPCSDYDINANRYEGEIYLINTKSNKHPGRK